MKNISKYYFFIVFIFIFVSCKGIYLDPAKRYQKEHSDKEWKGWKNLNKKLDKVNTFEKDKNKTVNKKK